MQRTSRHLTPFQLARIVAATALLLTVLSSVGTCAASARTPGHRYRAREVGAAQQAATRKPTGKKASIKHAPAKRSTTSSTAGHRSTTKSTSPGAGSIYWGAVTGTQFDHGGQAPWDMKVVSDFTKADAQNKPVSIVPFYSAFEDCTSSPCADVTFPGTVMQNVRDYGAIPMISWGSSSLQDPSYNGVSDRSFTLAGVASGQYDSYITAWAKQAKAFGHPFFLRFDWEMNGNWFVWGNNTNTNTAAEYVDAWRHVHDIFAQVGATNATWVWCPNNGDNNGSTASMASFYPGNAYVDWTCTDAYNFGATGGGKWESWDNIARAAYNTIQGIAPSKPMMIAEFASALTGGSQAAWLNQTLAEIPSMYPNIHAIVEYDASDPRWQLEGHPASQSAFAAGIQNPAYTTNSYGNLNSSPIPAP